MRKFLIRILPLLLMMLMSLQLFAQSRTVKGVVKDVNGNVVADAIVTVEGTSITSVTDDQGNFSISVPDGQNTLIVKAFGADKQSFTVSGNGIQNFQINTAVRQIKETVVTALGIKREKRSLGYAAPTVNSGDLESGGSFSPINSLNGKVAGVNIIGTGNGPNSSSRIVLRGESSISKSNQPLFVIDGIPMLNTQSGGGLATSDYGNRANDVNPDDIASITVLKGPAAAALYGSDGMFGAIIITTKSGQVKSKNSEKMAQVTFSSSYLLSSVLKLPNFQNEFGQGYFVGDQQVSDLRENFSWGPAFTGNWQPWGQEINGVQRVKPYSAIPKNVRDFFNIGTTFENNLGFNQTKGKSNFYLGFNTLNNKGVIPNNYLNKYGVRLNVTSELTKRLTSKISINYINQNGRYDQFGQGNGSVYNNVLQQPRDIPITELKDLNNVFNSMSVIDANGIERYGYYGAYTFNPYWVAQNYIYTQAISRIIGSVQLDYKLDDHWSLTDRFGADVYSDTRISKEPKINSSGFDEKDHGYLDDWTGLPHTSNGYYSESIGRFVQFNNDLILNYSNKINDRLSVGGLMGYNVFKSTVDATSAASNGGLVVPGYYNLSNSAGNVNADNNYQTKRKLGVYGSVNFGYMERLFLEITGRNDWSTAFLKGNRSYFYPGVNASWVFTESLNLGKVFTFGKLRTSWASVGSDIATSFDVLPSGYSSPTVNGGFGSTTFPFNGTPGFSYSNLAPNPNLKPERVNEFEIGTELGMFKDRLTLDFAYYNKNSFDLLTLASISTASGATQTWINAGALQNKGVELAVTGVPYKKSDNSIVWELFGTYTKNKSLVLKTNNENGFIGFGGFSGMSIGVIPNMPFGVFQTQYLMTDNGGHVIVDTTNGQPLINPNPSIISSFQPKFLASWGTSLKVKNFSLRILFDTRQGNYFYSRTKDIMDFVGTAPETIWSGSRADQIFPNSVKYASDGSLVANDIPMSLQQYYTNVIPGGSHIVNGSFVKLREANITYSFKKINNCVKWMDGLSISLFGNNLFMWAHKENIYADPEVNSNGATNSQGFDFSANPSLRNYGIKLNVAL